MARFAVIVDEEPPFEHDVLGDREHALLEHRPYPMREPVVEFGAATGSVTRSMPKRISAKVTALTWSSSSGWAVTNARTLRSGLERRSSERMLVSSSQPVKTGPRARAWPCGSVRDRYRDTARPAWRRSRIRR